jgi:hypothetical protein
VCTRGSNRALPGGPSTSPLGDRVRSVVAFAHAAWIGRAPLWKVFWLAGELFGTALAVVLFVVLPIGPQSPLAVAIAVPYVVWLYVSLWRCAYNVRARHWGDLTRIYVVAAVPVVLAGAAKIVSVGVGR